MDRVVEEAFKRGYTAEHVSMFDEDAVEGWEWFDPNGVSMGCEVGDWSEPPVPPDSFAEMFGMADA